MIGANADAIAAVPGVDAVLIGTNDLCVEMGIPGQYDHPDVVAAYGKVLAACAKHGKFPGMGGIRTDAQLRKYIGMGMRMILAGVEAGMIIAAGQERTAFMRGCA